jgi:hypothetical protein
MAQSIVTGRRRRYVPCTVHPPVPVRQPLAARNVNLPLAGLLIRSGCASKRSIATRLGLNPSSLRYAVDRSKGFGGVTLQPAPGAAATIAALIDQVGASASPLGGSSPAGFIPMLPMAQETGLAAGYPLRPLMDLYRRLSPRLTPEEAAELRARFLLEGESAASLSDQFGITCGQVWRLAIPRGRGRSLKGEQNGNARLTEADVLEIRRLHSEEGLGHRRIARLFGISRAAAYRILTGRAWAHVGAP